jgi:hypothetical protein
MYYRLSERRPFHLSGGASASGRVPPCAGYAERKKTASCVDCGKKNRSKFVQCTACRAATKAPANRAGEEGLSYFSRRECRSFLASIDQSGDVIWATIQESSAPNTKAQGRTAPPKS